MARVASILAVRQIDEPQIRTSSVEVDVPTSGRGHRGQRRGQIRMVGGPAVVCFLNIEVSADQPAGNVAQDHGQPEVLAVAEPFF
jgi:hypothetical protein